MRETQSTADLVVDGNRIHNQILLSLPRQEQEQVFSKLEFLRTSAWQVLHEPEDRLTSAYFCNAGLITFLSVLPERSKCVEVGLVGKEGFVGVPLIAGFRSAVTRAIIQIEGTAFRVEADLCFLPTQVSRTQSKDAASLSNYGNALSADWGLQFST